MYANVTSIGLSGLMGYLSCVEVDISKSMPGFDMVGMLSKEVKEAKERVRVALKNTDIKIPPVHITVNIAPAGVRKEGTAYDLPIAVGIMVALGYIPAERLKDICFLGELGLNGEIKPMKGILPMVVAARKNKMRLCMIPCENYREGNMIPGIRIVGVKNFAQVMEYLTDIHQMEQMMERGQNRNLADVASQKTHRQLDFCDVRGQEIGKKVAMIAAAGFHHILLMGPPGSGKTMIAKRMAGILPPMSEEEILEVSTIYSVSGKLSSEHPLVTERPFVAPHHTVTAKTLTGGGGIPQPGMISLSHKGVLFLDELPEFGRESIEVLRQPLEEKKIQIARSRGVFTYPADFMLVASCNLCPCGFYPNREKCKCTERDIVRYFNRISAPIRDRMDLCITTSRVEMKDLTDKKEELGTVTMQKKVLKARAFQQKRFQGTDIGFNGNIPVHQIETYCMLGKKEQEYVNTLFPAMQLSARSYHKVLRVARTIADLDGAEQIQVSHLAEAVCYRLHENELEK